MIAKKSTACSHISLPQPTPSPLLGDLQKNRIRLWQLARITGRSTWSLSMMLRGLIPMPADIEAKIRDVLRQVEAAA